MIEKSREAGEVVQEERQCLPRPADTSQEENAVRRIEKRTAWRTRKLKTRPKNGAKIDGRKGLVKNK
jgi:hypothetical protein